MTVADPDRQIRGGEGGGRSSRPWDKGGRPVWSKNKGGGPLPCILHCICSWPKRDILIGFINSLVNNKWALKALCYLFKKPCKKCLHMNLIPKIMVQFCYLRLYSGIWTVSCRLLQPTVRMGINWNFKKVDLKITKTLVCAPSWS